MALARDRGERVLTNGDKHGLPTPVQHSGSENVELKPGPSLTAAWNRFNGHGRKRVGFLQSIKAVVFSSCTSATTISGCSWNLLRVPRPERVVAFPSNRVGFPLPSLGRKQDFRMYVPSSRSRVLVRLLIGIDVFDQYASSLSFLWKNSLIGVGSKWRCTSDCPWAICS